MACYANLSESRWFNSYFNNRSLNFWLNSILWKKDDEYLNIPGDAFTGTEEEYKSYMTGTGGVLHKAKVETRKQFRKKYGGGDARG